jgi:hypothetical protein
MKRLIVLTCISPFAWTAIAMAQPWANASDNTNALPVASVAASPSSRPEYLPPTPVAPQTAPAPTVPYSVASASPTSSGSPGESATTPEARAREMRLMQAQAQEESIHRAAVARAEQRTRRLESQRWFGMSNKRPNAGVDPVDGDYAPFWASNYPFYPMRWVGSGEPWGFVEAQ